MNKQQRIVHGQGKILKLNFPLRAVAFIREFGKKCAMTAKKCTRKRYTPAKLLLKPFLFAVEAAARFSKRGIWKNESVITRIERDLYSFQPHMSFWFYNRR